MPSAPSSAETSTPHQVDIGQAADPLDQVMRHGRRQRLRATGHAGGMAGEKDRRLARRIAAADQGDLLARAELRLERRCPIMDGRAFEILDRQHRGGDSGRRWRPRRRAPGLARHWRGASGGASARGAARTRARRPRPGSPSRRRTSAPGYRPGPSAPCRRCRSESRDNSRSGPRPRPGRRTPGNRAPAPKVPRTRHKPRWPSRPARRRPRRRRTGDPDRSARPGRGSGQAASLGLRSNCRRDTGRSAIRRAATWKRSIRVARGVAVGIEALIGMAVAGRKFSSRSTSAIVGVANDIGPPAPVSIRPTRRRISARMIRSPSSASATSRARSRSGGIARPRRRPRTASTSGAGRTAGRARP